MDRMAPVVDASGSMKDVTQRLTAALDRLRCARVTARQRDREARDAAQEVNRAETEVSNARAALDKIIQLIRDGGEA